MGFHCDNCISYSLIIALAIVFLFGGKKIPELMKGIGGGIKEFKKASKEDDSEEEKTK